ncbi:MAG: phosphatidylinositol-specific phospholipase C domain-containing protein [Candidatus Sericytochromatia bacterium]
MSGFKKYLFLGALLLLACHRENATLSPVALPPATTVSVRPARVVKSPQSPSATSQSNPSRAAKPVSTAPAPESPLSAQDHSDWQAELQELTLFPITASAEQTATESPEDLKQALAQVQAASQAVKLAQVSGNVSIQAAVPVAECGLACRTEADLAKDLPLNQQQWLGGHNAYNYKGIFKNQYWTIPQQLTAGVRVLELDLHTRLLSGKVRVCHGASSRDCLLNPFGVKDYAPLLKEIKTWSDQHPDQLLILELENHVKNEKAVLEPIQSLFGPLIYRADQRPENWAEETPAQIVARGKRVIVADFGKNRFDGKWVWDQNELASNHLSKDFSPDCTVKGQPMAGKRWGFYDDKTFGKAKPLTAESIPGYLACNANYLKIDRLNPTLIAARHFAWDTIPAGKSCASLSANGQRWQAESCERALRVACRVEEGWKISAASGDWTQGTEICRREFGETASFAPPRNYYQNHQLGQTLAATSSPVWLGYRAP